MSGGSNYFVASGREYRGGSSVETSTDSAYTVRTINLVESSVTESVDDNPPDSRFSSEKSLERIFDADEDFELASNEPAEFKFPISSVQKGIESVSFVPLELAA
jgi:hypothetical protein